MDTAQWPQGIGVVKNGGENTKPGVAEKKPRPSKEQALNCPRCSSTNTKFCYYNNYSLSQPRYFCKTCRRYWTEGGSLRNVPVGGGSRKNKRPSLSSVAKKEVHDLGPQDYSPQNPNIDHQDLSLGFDASHYNEMSEFTAVPFGIGSKNPDPEASRSHHFPVMELFNKAGRMNISSGGFVSALMSSQVSDSNSVYSSAGFPLSESRPSLGFENYGNINNIHSVDDQANSSRGLFPFEELKPVSDGQGETNAYWNGMLAGGSW